MNKVLAFLILRLLRLRYRITIEGLEKIAGNDRSGILFLPNHPALIDPVILLAILTPRFRPRPLADERQVDRPFLRGLARRLRTITIPDVTEEGRFAADRVRAGITACIEALRRGDNVLLYPSGHVYRSRYENLRGNSAAATVLGALPRVRVVLVRTTGLWGSRFSRASGKPPDVGRLLRRAALEVLASGIFFVPKREVSLVFEEPADLPRSADRRTLNQRLEAFYNHQAPPNTYVPRTPWERGGVRILPEPQPWVQRGNPADVPQGIRQAVLEHLREVAGVSELREDAHLARDLGLDSLARTELLVWLEREFGLPQPDAEAFETVGDLLLGACGQLVSGTVGELRAPPPAWFRPAPGKRAEVLPAETVPEAFLLQALRRPRRLIAADQRRGALSYRAMLTAILALRSQFRRLPGRNVGVMLPASVAADLVWLALLFSNKVPVMLNWTVGRRALDHGLKITGVQKILTADALLRRLASTGFDAAGLESMVIPLERLAAEIPRKTRLAAWLGARWFPPEAPPDQDGEDPAVILFTSGSESLPKAVPLTHVNLLTNARTVLEVVPISDQDRLLGMLPPFHSFGLTAGMVMPLCANVPVFHSPDPTQGALLAQAIETWGLTILAGTPTFLHGILRAIPKTSPTIRLAVTGAEKCPDAVYAAFAKKAPNATVLEGYGITECSPVVAVNTPDSAKPGTIGRVLPCFEYAVVDPETGTPAPVGERGMLLVRGPCVFPGYLGEAPSPFTRYAGRDDWYRTGDLVVEAEDGTLTFAGRLKRFVKIGGEMISLPAIEAVLAARFTPPEAEGPALAVTASGPELHPELVLFTVLDLDRRTANQALRQAGLSGLHHIRRVVRLEALPLLGAGKTDYRALLELTRRPPPAALPPRAGKTNHNGDKLKENQE